MKTAFKPITQKQLLRYLKGKRITAIDMEADIVETTDPYRGDQWRKYASTGRQIWTVMVDLP